MRIIDKNYLLVKLSKINGQAMPEYALMTSLIYLVVVNIVKAFGVALDGSFCLAIVNMTGYNPITGKATY